MIFSQQVDQQFINLTKKKFLQKFIGSGRTNTTITTTATTTTTTIATTTVTTTTTTTITITTTTIERPFGLCRRSVKLAGASARLNYEIRMLAPSRHGDKTRRPSGIILGFGISILCLVIFCYWAVIVLE